MLPLWLDHAGADYTGYDEGNVFNDSFGARRILGGLVRGELFDTQRLPVVTVLAAVGLAVGVARARHHLGFRVVALIGSLSLVLFFGRPTLGPLLRLVPLGSDLFYPRFIIGVHLAGILLAGIGLAAAIRLLVAQLARIGPRSLATAIALLAALFVLAPAVQDRWHDESGEPSAVGAGALPAGAVTTSVADPEHGRFTVGVDADRPASLAVAVSWHPRLGATVDGAPVDVSVIAPGTAGVPIPAGEHVGKLWYRPFPYTIVVFVVGVLVLVAVAAPPLWLRRRVRFAVPRLGRSTHLDD